MANPTPDEADKLAEDFVDLSRCDVDEAAILIRSLCARRAEQAARAMRTQCIAYADLWSHKYRNAADTPNLENAAVARGIADTLADLSRAYAALPLPSGPAPAVSQRYLQLETAAAALVADVRRRYPGEELRCPLMRALDDALAGGE